MITQDIGTNNNVRRINKAATPHHSTDLFLEVQFNRPEEDKAISVGFSHNDKCYKGTPSNLNSTVSPIMFRLQSSNFPLLYQMSKSQFTTAYSTLCHHLVQYCNSPSTLVLVDTMKVIYQHLLISLIRRIAERLFLCNVAYG